MIETEDITVEVLSIKHKDIFKGVYYDFIRKSKKNYLFESEPLNYDDFFRSLENQNMTCLTILENSIPTGFLAFNLTMTTSIEINILHLIDSHNLELKVELLFKSLFKLIKSSKEYANKAISFPLVGVQKDYFEISKKLGFNFVSSSILNMYLNDDNVVDNYMNSYSDISLINGFKLKKWDDKYTSGTIKLIKEAFEGELDNLFDPRFKSIDGCSDIVEKILKSIYGIFLPNVTQVLIKEDNNEVCGICFLNLSTGSVANIPLMALKKDLRGQGLGLILLKSVLKELFMNIKSKLLFLNEVNVTANTDNFAAMNTYKKAGFKIYTEYPHIYINNC